MKYIKFKSFIDKTIALFTIIVISPILISIYFCILFKLGKPVFFLQERPGYKSRGFKIIKFRTMLNSNNDSTSNETDENRLTELGIFLRKYSLDELPELINIIRGEMSFVGPRPLLMQYLNLYTPEQLKRHDVLPGITGYAQINGRNLLSWEEKFKYDLIYVEKQSFIFDLMVLIKTFLVVIFKKGISAKGEATMYAFRGNQEK